MTQFKDFKSIGWEPFGWPSFGQNLLAFSPDNLFASNEQGAWYDPADLSTLFQYSLGTTPVTTAGQPVGRMLDKSQGLVLGPELVTNNNFTNGTTGWSGSGAALSVVAGRLRVTVVSSYGSARASFATEIGKTYQYNFNRFNGTAGNNSIRIGTSNGGSQILNVFASNSEAPVSGFFVATATTTYLTFYAWSTTVGNYSEYNNITVKTLPGNHATQATSAARPTYAVAPLGGRRNLFEYSQDFTNAAWAKQGVNIGAAVTAPDGSADALPFVETTGTGEHNAFETVTGALTSGEPTTFSTFYKYVDRPFANVRVLLTGSWTNTFFNVQTGVIVSTGAGLTSAIEDFGGGWYRCSVTVLSASSTGNASVTVGMSADGTAESYTGDGTSSILIYGAQIEQSATATAYQKVATQYDVTEAGVKTLHYLASDGVDDALNWTATANDYTIARVNSSGTVTIQTTQALSGATDIFAAEDDIAGYVAVNRALTTAETSGLTAYLEGLAT
jgi:hypothetical protein